MPILHEELLEKTLESLLDCTEIQPVHPKGNQSWIFTGRTDAEAENPIFGHLKRRTDSLEKTLMLGKTEGRRRGQQRMRWLDGIIDSKDMSLINSMSWWGTGEPSMLQSLGLQRVGHEWATEKQQPHSTWGLLWADSCLCISIHQMTCCHIWHISICGNPKQNGMWNSFS